MCLRDVVTSSRCTACIAFRPICKYMSVCTYMMNKQMGSDTGRQRGRWIER